jgi:hypothetical protein
LLKFFILWQASTARIESSGRHFPGLFRVWMHPVKYSTHIRAIANMFLTSP